MQRTLSVLTVFGFLLVLLPVAAFGQQLFDSWLSYNLDNQPMSVASGDLDGDGDLDLAMGHWFGDRQGRPTVVVMENDGAGNFRRAATLLASARVINVSLFDLDRDGDLDILSAHRDADNANFFRNRGGLAFDLPYLCRTGTSPFSITAGRLDNDSFPEMIVANAVSGTLSLYKNRGVALFPSESTKVVGINPRSVALLDYDNDGDNDIAASVQVKFDAEIEIVTGFNGIVTFENEGNGAINDSVRVNYRIRSTFNPTLTDTGLRPEQLIAADFNNDGFADLALACTSKVANLSEVRVFLNRQTSDSTFDITPNLANPGRYPVGFGCKSIAALDVDGDGDLDLVSANQFDATISVLKNNGNGTFAPKKDFFTPNNPPSVVSVGDFDGDGDFDVAALSETGRSVAIMKNKGNGDYEVGTEFSTGQNSLAFGLACADFEGDGDIDVAVANQTNNYSSIHKNNGSGSFPSPPPGTDWYFSGSPRSVAVADLDGNGTVDFAVANQGTSGVSIFWNSGGGSFAYGPTYFLGGSFFPYWVTAADLDGDGDVDLATANFGKGTVSVLRNNNNGTFSVTGPYPVGSLPIYINHCDFNGDGHIDLVTANQGSNANPDSVTLLFNDGTGTFPARTDLQVGSNLTAVEAADLDGDGDCDLAVTAEGYIEVRDTAVVIFSNNGDGTFTKGQRLTPGAGPRDVIAADINGDGRPDLVTADSARSAVSFFANTGGSLVNSLNYAFAPPQQYGAGFNPRFLCAADFDNDGDRDLAVTNLRMVNSPVAGQTHGGFTLLENVGTIPRPLARGDVNADGVCNLADATAELNCVFFGSGACPLGAADANCDGRLSAVDLVLLLQHVFFDRSFPC
jgi:hypothetical protein